MTGSTTALHRVPHLPQRNARQAVTAVPVPYHGYTLAAPPCPTPAPRVAQRHTSKLDSTAAAPQRWLRKCRSDIVGAVRGGGGVLA